MFKVRSWKHLSVFRRTRSLTRLKEKGKETLIKPNVLFIHRPTVGQRRLVLRREGRLLSVNNQHPPGSHVWSPNLREISACYKCVQSRAKNWNIRLSLTHFCCLQAHFFYYLYVFVSADFQTATTPLKSRHSAQPNPHNDMGLYLSNPWK